MRLKIVSDGTAKNTFVTNEEGEILQGVTYVSWSCRNDSVGVAELQLVGVPVELVSAHVLLEGAVFRGDKKDDCS